METRTRTNGDHDIQPLLAHIDIRRLLSVLLSLPDVNNMVEEKTIQKLNRAFCHLSGLPTSPAEELLVALMVEDQVKLSQDFKRLFQGGHRLPASPYGSVYLEEDRRTFGRTTLDVQRQLTAEGVDVHSELHQPPDHATTELDFSAFLIERCVELLVSGKFPSAGRQLSKVVEFERLYLLTWLPDLAMAIGQAAETRFYGAMADCLQFLATELPPPALPQAARRAARA